MKNAFLWLLTLCAFMFGGSFLAGNAPLLLHLSERRLQQVSGYGAGLLVGVSFGFLDVVLVRKRFAFFGYEIHGKTSCAEIPIFTVDGADRHYSGGRGDAVQCGETRAWRWGRR